MARRPTAHPTARIPMAVRLAGPIHRRILISRPGTAIRFTLGCSPGTEGSSLTDFLEVCLFIIPFCFLFFVSLEGGGGRGGEGEERREGGREGGSSEIRLGTFVSCFSELSTLVLLRIGLLFDLS